MLYILDTGAILQRPEILAHAAGGDLLIPQAAVDDIRDREKRGLRADLAHLLDRSIEAGAVVAPPADGGIAEIALTLAAENGAENVRVVTTDRRLVRFLESKGVTSIDGSDLLSAQATAPSDAGIEQAARRIVRAQHRNLASGLAIALAGTAVAIVIVINHQLIFHTAPDWIVPIALLLAGLLFFWWRERDRLSYGLFEVMIGLLISSQSIVTLPAPSELSTAKSIQLVGGLYVMVRGLDNIDRSIEDTLRQLVEMPVPRWPLKSARLAVRRCLPAPNRQRIPSALDVEGFSRAEAVAIDKVRRRDHELATVSGGAEPRCDVHAVADHRVVAALGGADRAGHDLAREHADPDLTRQTGGSAGLEDGARRGHGTLGGILATEVGEQGVPNQLVDIPAMVVDRPHLDRHQLIEKGDHGLRRTGFCEAGEGADIRVEKAEGEATRGNRSPAVGAARGLSRPRRDEAFDASAQRHHRPGTRIDIALGAAHEPPERRYEESHQHRRHDQGRRGRPCENAVEPVDRLIELEHRLDAALAIEQGHIEFVDRCSVGLDPRDGRRPGALDGGTQGRPLLDLAFTLGDRVVDRSSLEIVDLEPDELQLVNLIGERLVQLGRVGAPSGHQVEPGRGRRARHGAGDRIGTPLRQIEIDRLRGLTGTEDGQGDQDSDEQGEEGHDATPEVATQREWLLFEGSQVAQGLSSRSTGVALRPIRAA